MFAWSTVPGWAQNALAATTTFVATADAHVKSSNQTTNYGAVTTLQVRAPSPEYRSYLRFTVSGLPGPASAAKLRLFVTDASPNGGQIFLVSGSWTETTITWNSAPPLGASLGTAGSVTAGTWVEIALPAGQFPGNGSYSVAITTSSTNSAIYSSREGTNPPQLVLTAGSTPTPTPTPSPTPSPTPTATPSPTPTATPSPTPTATPPTASFTAGVIPGTLDVQFTDQSVGVPDSWSWDFGDGSAGDTTVDPLHTFPTPGTYVVTLTVGNAQGQSQESLDVAVDMTAPPAPTPTPTVTPTPTPTPTPGPPTGGAGILISTAELARLPTSGPAWDALKAVADTPPGPANIADLVSPHDVRTLAEALVYARTGVVSYRDEVVMNLRAAIGSEAGARTLELGRNLPAYIFAADLIDLADADAGFDRDTFRPWLASLRTMVMADGATLIMTDEGRPNNWGTHAGDARAAIAIYLGDAADLARTAQVFKGWLGDRSSYAGFLYGDLSWQCDPIAPVGINPAGCLKSGIDIGGALPEEMRRGGSFKWPPATTVYAWEGLQGATVEAEILTRAGYPAWTWSDSALRRAVEFLYLRTGWPATGDDTWIPWLVNAAYGTALPTVTPTTFGKNLGFTDWLYGPSSEGTSTAILATAHASDPFRSVLLSLFPIVVVLMLAIVLPRGRRRRRAEATAALCERPFRVPPTQRPLDGPDRSLAPLPASRPAPRGPGMPVGSMNQKLIHTTLVIVPLLALVTAVRFGRSRPVGSAHDAGPIEPRPRRRSTDRRTTGDRAC
jgi:PKD repeat protein